MVRLDIEDELVAFEHLADGGVVDACWGLEVRARLVLVVARNQIDRAERDGHTAHAHEEAPPVDALLARDLRPALHREVRDAAVRLGRLRRNELAVGDDAWLEGEEDGQFRVGLLLAHADTSQAGRRVCN